ncbi:MAG TPA: hypothetical protein VE690_14910, partial [Rhodopila sp.]|nr:hypothetical protein [Rhodopila sp.]
HTARLPRQTERHAVLQVGAGSRSKGCLTRSLPRAAYNIVSPVAHSPFTGDSGRSRLDQIVNPAHALVKMARAINWRFLEDTFEAVYTDDPGQASLRQTRAVAPRHPAADLPLVDGP